MKRLLLPVFFFVALHSISQTYTLRVIAITATAPDSLYMKNSGQDTLWRKTNNVWSQAYLAKQWAYFPFYQPINTPTTAAGYGITNVALNTTTVNGHALNANVIVTPADVGLDTTRANVWNALSGKQASITTGTTAQYIRGDLSLATFPITTAGFSNSTDKNFVSDAKLAVVNNTIGVNTGDQTTVSGNAGTATALQNVRTINGTSFDGTANITIPAAAGTLTGATLAAGVTASSLTSLGVIAAFTAGTISQTGKTATYNNIATVSNGIPSEYATVDLTAQAANIGATTLYSVPATGMYRVSIYIAISQIATTSSTMPSTTITYTDGINSTVHSTTTTATAATNSLTTSFAQTTYICYAKTGTNIQYASGSYASSGAQIMNYHLRIKVEAL